jgi:hypothetical protein
LPGPARLRVIGAMTTRLGNVSGPRRKLEKTSIGDIDFLFQFCRQDDVIGNLGAK